MNQRNTEYSQLIDDLQDLIAGQKLDDVIPALSGIVVHAMSMSGVPKEECIDYMVKTINDCFEKTQ